MHIYTQRDTTFSQKKTRPHCQAYTRAWTSARAYRHTCTRTHNYISTLGVWQRRDKNQSGSPGTWMNRLWSKPHQSHIDDLPQTSISLLSVGSGPARAWGEPQTPADLGLWKQTDSTSWPAPKTICAFSFYFTHKNIWGWQIYGTWKERKHCWVRHVDSRHTIWDVTVDRAEQCAVWVTAQLSLYHSSRRKQIWCHLSSLCDSCLGIITMLAADQARRSAFSECGAPPGGWAMKHHRIVKRNISSNKSQLQPPQITWK